MSLYRIARAVCADLEERKFPVSVHYGQERISREGSDSHVITIRRDWDASERIESGPGTKGLNARRKLMRMIPGVLEVRARSLVAGARPEDHEALADKLVDALLVAITDKTREITGYPPAFSGAQMLSPEQHSGAEIASGAVYEIRFSVPRSVNRVEYDGSGQDEATLSAVETALGDVT